MDVQKIIHNQVKSVKQNEQALRPGQIIQGKILKLFPNNKAQIQIGTSQLVAQLEASLEIGKGYFFQVQKGKSPIQLKVISDSLKQNQQLDVEHLLLELGMKQTKGNKAFVEILLQKKIPFDQEQLQKALQLLESAANKTEAQNQLSELIANRIPISKEVFQALTAKEGFGDQLRLLEQSVQQNQTVSPGVKDPLLHLLGKLTGNSSESKWNQFIQLTDNPALFHILKALRLVNRDIQFAAWHNQLGQPGSTYGENIFPVNYAEIAQSVMEIPAKLDKIGHHASAILQEWGDMLHERVAKGIPFSDDSFPKLIKDVNQHKRGLTKFVDFKVDNSPQELRNLIIDLEVLANEENRLNVRKFLNQYIKETFSQQMTDIRTESGLNYEKAILNGDLTVKESLKGKVLQLLQSADGNIKESASKLLHVLNGIQLQSVQETGNLLQVNLTIPAEKFALRKDIEVSFEGAKNKTGEISADYCKVVFFLELKNIDETVVAMHVQKRMVSLTIWNDHSIGQLTKELQSSLNEGLEKMNYQLSSITHKPLSNKESFSPSEQGKQASIPMYQGVDFRI